MIAINNDCDRISINNNNSIYTNDIEEALLDGEDSQTSSSESAKNIEEENVYPMKELKVDKGFYTAYELKRKYGKTPSQIVLDSDFQRKSVWSLQQKRELIESVIMGLPLPIFYFNEDKKGRLVVVDGRQRLTALFEFISNSFSLDKLKILDEFNKKKFKDLDPTIQSKIEDYQIMAHVIKPPTPDRIKFDIFDRVNRAGTQLNKQEIRNALYQGAATKLLCELTEELVFAKATENTFVRDKRMKDRYLLLRFIAFYLYFNHKLFKDNKPYQYMSDVDEILGITMEYLNNLDDEQIHHIKSVTLQSLEQVNFYLGINAFRLVDIVDGKEKRYPININIFENIMFAMTLIPYCDYNLKEKVKQLFDDMKNSERFRNSINNHRDNVIKVTERYNIIFEIIGEINDKYYKNKRS